jgi:hypothetical protein
MTSGPGKLQEDWVFYSVTQKENNSDYSTKIFNISEF